MNDRLKDAFPLKSHSEKTDEQLLRDYAIDHDYTQMIIIGVDDRNEYATQVYGENDTELRFADRYKSAITKALRDEGLTPRLI